MTDNICAHDKDGNVLLNEDGSPMSFKKFNILEVMNGIKNMSVAIYGKRRTGKTVVLRDLLSQVKDLYTDVHCFSMTGHLQKSIYDFIPSDQIYQGMDVEKLEEIYKAQEAYVAEEMLKRPKRISESDYKKSLDHIVLIFDDIITDPRTRSSTLFKSLFTLGRHNCISVWVISQEMGGRAGLGKDTRANLDLVISFFLNAENDRKLFVEQYISTQDKKTGHDIYNSITQAENSYRTIVVANHFTTPIPDHYLYSFVASLDIGKFMIKKKEKKGKKIKDIDVFYKNRILKQNTIPSSEIVINFKKPKTEKIMINEIYT